jgi:hypothetical protein
MHSAAAQLLGCRVNEHRRLRIIPQVRKSLGRKLCWAWRQFCDQQAMQSLHTEAIVQSYRDSCMARARQQSWVSRLAAQTRLRYVVQSAVTQLSRVRKSYSFLRMQAGLTCRHWSQNRLLHRQQRNTGGPGCVTAIGTMPQAWEYAQSASVPMLQTNTGHSCQSTLSHRLVQGGQHLREHDVVIHFSHLLPHAGPVAADQPAELWQHRAAAPRLLHERPQRG